MIFRLPLIGTRLSRDRGDETDQIRPIPWHQWLSAGAPGWQARLVESSLDLDNAEAEYEITAANPLQQAALDNLLDTFDKTFPGVGGKRRDRNALDYVDLVRMRRIKPDGSVELERGRPAQ